MGMLPIHTHFLDHIPGIVRPVGGLGDCKVLRANREQLDQDDQI